jgi:glycosyltransferase involved in cell wall biosynthesis
MQAPKISILIIAGEAESDLFRAVGSVLAQSVPDFEILILDGKSAAAENPGAPMSGFPDPRVRRVTVPPGTAAAALNLGIGQASAPWLIWLDANDSLVADMLERCLSGLESDGSVSILYPDRRESYGEERVLPSSEYDFQSLTRSDGIPYCALFSKRAWLDVGGFRTNVEGDEAWDFWIACGSRGFTGRRLASPLVLSGKTRSALPAGRTPRAELRIAQIRINNRECYSHEETQAAEELLGQSGGAGARPSFHPSRIPMVTVVVPTYNRTDTLKIALESIQTQTYRDFEIVVVSDCGSNSLEALLQELNTRQNITYVRHGTNRGLGASRNTGIGATRGKYIAYLDDDDFFYPDHLETLVGYLEKSGEKVAYTDAHRVWQHKVDGVYTEFKRDAPYGLDFDYDRILIHNFVPVLCFMHARECLREVGVFDESLSTHEDWDLWIRMSRKYRMHRIPRFTSAFTHREDGTSMSVRRKRSFLDTSLAIYAKLPETVRDRPEIREAQRRRIAEMQAAYGVPPETSVSVPLLPTHARAIGLLNTGNPQGAIRTLESLSAEGKADARAENDLAVLLYRSGSPGPAETHFRSAMALDPRLVSAIRNLGDMCLAQSRLRDAMELLKCAFELDPLDAETSFSLGELSGSLGEREAARSFYQRVLELNPEHPRARQRLDAQGARDGRLTGPAA